jgi:hypothetical protein
VADQYWLYQFDLLFKIDRFQATSYSLLVGSAMIGSFSHKLGNLKIKSALSFAIPLYLCYWSEKLFYSYF